MRKEIHKYYDLNTGNKESPLGFLVAMILKAKGKNAAKKCFDEDVNIYLAEMLFELLEPSSWIRKKRYISLYDTDVVKMIEEAAEQYQRYLIYRLNADNLLVHLGIFRDVQAEEKGDTLGLSREYYEGNGRKYYDLAAGLNRRINRKATAVSDVLEKLSYDFLLYEKLLRNLSDEYLCFTDELDEKGFKKGKKGYYLDWRKLQGGGHHEG